MLVDVCLLVHVKLFSIFATRDTISWTDFKLLIDLHFYGSAACMLGVLTNYWKYYGIIWGAWRNLLLFWLLHWLFLWSLWIWEYWIYYQIITYLTLGYINCYVFPSMLSSSHYSLNCILLDNKIPHKYIRNRLFLIQRAIIQINMCNNHIIIIIS